ncbi:MAG: alpha-D-glucose phosphate-specific phosphoglucomutase [Rickettsiales bacterium]|jgi:phosphoglucomutase|nr:alpha-D-glucose phosphate-specific phosphoglucomutase [Rickettsiales bacterium]
MIKINTSPYFDQKPGTGGLRARTKRFLEPNYLENFIQSALTAFAKKNMRTNFFVLVGDGRFPGDGFLPRIIRVLRANGAERIMVARGATPTPALSHAIRKYRADGGFIMSASHNPGGLDGDFGIKVELSSGGGAPESFTSLLFEETKKIKEYKTLDLSDDATMASAEYVDAIGDYADLMESMFDFSLIRKWFSDGRAMRFDAMNASTGEPAREIFVNRLGAPLGSIVRGIPLPDFGGIHPEPNPHYDPELVEFMSGPDAADFGVACDGDGDRNMILGKGTLVYPPDSLAIMMRYHKLIPYFKDGLKGVARSIPTSSAVDLVAKKMGINSYATPTGWKYFASLLDADMISLCGEESFGQGGDYIREKDAIFAVLFWLNIMAATKKTPRQLLIELWRDFGRTFYTQYSFEGVDKAKADELYEYIKSADMIGRDFGAAKIKSKEDLKYKDPATGEVAPNVGIEIKTTDDTRIFFRLSGTGTVGATLRFYIEKFEQDPNKIETDLKEYMKDAYESADKLFRIKEYFPNAQKTIAI